MHVQFCLYKIGWFASQEWCIRCPGLGGSQRHGHRSLLAPLGLLGQLREGRTILKGWTFDN